MIENIEIKNFKSVFDLKLELGRFNVFIGENGCGKTNILEAIAFGAAASADKLDNEFLYTRGIRVTNPDLMISAFENSTPEIRISIIDSEIPLKDNSLVSEISFDNSNNSWSAKQKLHLEDFVKIFNDTKNIENKLQLIDNITPILRIEEYLNSKIFTFKNSIYSKFLIYRIEETILRKFEEEGQILPLGIRGEGLFSYLKKLSQSKEGQAQIEEIKENLALLDWFSDFGMSKNGLSNENRIRIKDKYLQAVKEFDQRSANEGFLFLLFYLTLFTSKHTPQFFAIDNIESSFNPKLCTELTKILVNLSKKHQKQVIVTTHNPALLDGLDLNDEETRLFVIRRNSKGHTVAKRITQKPQSENHIKLSEAWMKGFIGGIPQNF